MVGITFMVFITFMGDTETVSLARVQKLTFSYIHCSGEKSSENRIR